MFEFSTALHDPLQPWELLLRYFPQKLQGHVKIFPWRRLSMLHPHHQSSLLPLQCLLFPLR